MIVVRQAGPNEIGEVRELLTEYSRWLGDPGWLGTDLGFGDFREELQALPGPYAGPRGCLLLADVDGVTVGCVALRPLDEDACEMKRLYVRPAFRGRGLGHRLVEEVLVAARRAGCRSMRLDTLPVMEKAQSLYRSLGFRITKPYHADPIEGTVFMERDLTGGSPAEGNDGSKPPDQNPAPRPSGIVVRSIGGSQAATRYRRRRWRAPVTRIAGRRSTGAGESCVRRGGPRRPSGAARYRRRT